MNKMMQLKSDVKLVERDGVPGLSLAGRVRLAKDEWQAVLIRALAAREQPLKKLQLILRARDGPPPDEAAAALELTAFILDFDPYIES